MIADGLKYEYSSTTFDSSLGYQDIEIVKGGDIETKRVYLVKGHSTHAYLQYNAHLQYNGLYGTGSNFKQVNNYGNQVLSLTQFFNPFWFSVYNFNTKRYSISTIIV